MQQGMVKALGERKPESMEKSDWEELQAKAVATIRLCLTDDVMYHVMDEESPVTVWQKLESRYMSKSLTNKLYLKQKLFGLKMTEGTDLSQHINVFNQIVSDLKRIDVKIEDEEKMLMLLNSLSLSPAYENLVTTLMWGKETLKLEEITSALLGFHQRKKTSDEISQGEGLVVNSNQERGRSKSQHEIGNNNKARSKSRRKKVITCYKCGGKGHMKRYCPKIKKHVVENNGSLVKFANIIEKEI